MKTIFLSTGMKSVSFSLFMLFFTLTISAQTLQEYGQMIAAMKASPDPVIVQQAAHLDSLVFKIQPKIYISNFVETVSGETAPVCVDSDALSVSMLSESKPLFQTVELIKIRLNVPEDLSFVLDLTALPGFGNLKYVQFFCGYDCNPQAISALFLSNNPGITVFYNISVAN